MPGGSAQLVKASLRKDAVAGRSAAGRPQVRESGPLMLDPARLRAAYEQVKQRAAGRADADGHWVGELSSSALSTATAVERAGGREAGSRVQGPKSKVREPKATPPRPWTFGPWTLDSLISRGIALSRHSTKPRWRLRRHGPVALEHCDDVPRRRGAASGRASAGSSMPTCSPAPMPTSIARAA